MKIDDLNLASIKFPDLYVGGQQLIWDSRQTIKTKEVRVFLLKDRTAEVHRSLEQLECSKIFNIEEATEELGRQASEALGHPSRKLNVLAITGTNGKSTCVGILRQFLCLQGHHVAEIGTLGLRIFGPGSARLPIKEYEIGFTTPESPTLQIIFDYCLKQKISYVVMEASSHGCELGRVSGICLSGAGFTNLSQDHLDYHKSMENYFAAKRKLFTKYLKESEGLREGPQRSPFGVIHADGMWGARLAAELSHNRAIHALKSERDYKIESLDSSGTTFTFRGSKFRSSLIGTHNVENLVLCLEIMERLGKPASESDVSMVSAPLGRMQRLDEFAPNRFLFIDYAHTPDALDRSLETLQDVRTSSQKIHVVFGCGGDRDPSKRGLMGGVAGRRADFVYLTSDNPRTEDPLAIIEQIKQGVTKGSLTKVTVQPDRRLAIKAALDSSRLGDIILIAGKGHETYQIVGSDRLPFSDATVALSFL